MNIAVMALQGAFIEHEAMLRRLGADCFEVRQASDWERPKDGLILPGGESTVQRRLLEDLGLFEAVRREILAGLPVLGTCAGMILLSGEHLATMHMRVRRNAYGRQLGSFHAAGRVEGIGEDLPMTFIRAPYIEETLARPVSPSPASAATSWRRGKADRLRRPFTLNWTEIHEFMRHF